VILGAIALVAVAGAAWWRSQRAPASTGFAIGNGRLEAEEVHIATKLPGRIAEVLVHEGDAVEAGQALARMDTASLEATLAQAKAQVTQAETQRAAAEATDDQRMTE